MAIYKDKPILVEYVTIESLTNYLYKSVTILGLVYVLQDLDLEDDEEYLKRRRKGKLVLFVDDEALFSDSTERMTEGNQNETQCWICPQCSTVNNLLFTLRKLFFQKIDEYEQSYYWMDILVNHR